MENFLEGNYYLMEVMREDGDKPIMCYTICC